MKNRLVYHRHTEPKSREKGDNADRVEMFRKDFIYTLFCVNIPDGQRVYRVNGSINDDNIKNLALQNEFQPHPVFDLYDASDKGIIRNRKTKIVLGNLHNIGYLHITVCGTKTDRVGYYFHRFIYETFKGAIPDDLVIDHINKLKTNNRLEHLDLVTSKENTKRGTGGDNNFKNNKNNCFNRSINWKRNEI